MIRCPWCGAKNYAIDMWCSRCSHHLDWVPPHRPRNRLISILAPIAAATGVVMALAIPTASWFAGAGPAVELTLPGTAGASPAAPAEVAPAAPVQSPPTAEPAATAEPTPTPDSLPQADATPAAQPEGHPAAPIPDQAALPNPSGDPAAVVRQFYEAISSHQFDVAVSLWTAAMQAQYPPSVFIDERFSATQQVELAAEHVVADGGGTAVVYVDVVEVIGGEKRRWLGTWQVVDTASGWLMNSANLQAQE